MDIPLPGRLCRRLRAWVRSLSVDGLLPRLLAARAHGGADANADAVCASGVHGAFSSTGEVSDNRKKFCRQMVGRKSPNF